MKEGILMVKCPTCKKEFEKHKKAWKYGHFDVKAYTCECGTDFREYTSKGRYSFTLKRKKGKEWVKA
jgi:hypothetical protein